MPNPDLQLLLICDVRFWSYRMSSRSVPPVETELTTRIAASGDPEPWLESCESFHFWPLVCTCSKSDIV